MDKNDKIVAAFTEVSKHMENLNNEERLLVIELVKTRYNIERTGTKQEGFKPTTKFSKFP